MRRRECAASRPSFERAIGREVEVGARHLQLANAGRPFLDQDANGFLVAQRGAGGQRVLRVKLGRVPRT